MTPQAVLGVANDAEPEVVDAAYRALMKKYHPDRSGSASNAAKAQEINAAYAAIRGRRSAEPVPVVAETKWEVPTIDLPPPLRIGERFGWALLASMAILLICVVISRA